MKKDEQSIRKPYTAPKCKAWGNVSDITRVGFTNPGDDVRGGSINPPGHENR